MHGTLFSTGSADVSEASERFGMCLQDKVVNEMEELYQFTHTANQVLDLRVGDEREAGEAEEDDDAEVLEGEELAAKRKEQEEQVHACSFVP